MSDQSPRRPPVVPEAPSKGGFVPLEEAARRLGYGDTEWRAAARSLPVRWPAAYLTLAEGPGGEPIRRMGVPDPEELEADAGDLADPVGESLRSAVPFVVQKHVDRAILLVTARCHFYCRFCFRRSFPDGDHRDPSAPQLDAALDHLLSQPGLREVILSGGDPLVLPEARLAAIVARIRRAPQVRTVRVHTRAPVHFPERVTADLVTTLAAAKPAWIVVHFDHPRELTAEALAAVGRLVDAGLPVMNQNVLLTGVNDDADVLAALYRGLYEARIRPYYLHHPDRAPGNARFRVTIPRGLEIYRELRGLVSGPALPAYVIDLPDGTGKVPVESLVEVRPGRWARGDGSSAFDDVPG